MNAYREVAVAFATALVHGEFVEAHRLLATALRAEFSLASLQNAYYGMIHGYADGEPYEVQYDDQNFTEEWPAKECGDIGWAYISICGEDFVEAVTVVVADVDGASLIRDVEWGRP
jgi:hypothetical protein